MTTESRFPRPPRNGCSACRSDFTNVKLFDAHRVGVHAYDWSLERADWRRCLSAEEMGALGWEQNKKGRWLDPSERDRTRETFSALRIRSGTAAETEDEPEAG